MPATPIREAGAALVEQDKARERIALRQETRQSRLFPIHLDIRDPSRHKHEVSRPFAQNLAGDMTPLLWA